MGIEVIALTLEFIGTLLIGVAVLKVHSRLRKEHRIDKRVLKIIRKERGWTIMGLVLITLGYAITLFNSF